MGERDITIADNMHCADKVLTLQKDNGGIDIQTTNPGLEEIVILQQSKSKLEIRTA